MTRTAQHTPGPWHLNGYDITDRTGGVIAVVCELSGEDDEPEANGKLMAAAPELLAALRKAEYYLNRFYVLAIQCADDPRYLVERDAINQAQTAIYNATTA